MEAGIIDPTVITLIGGQILTVIAAIAAAVVAVINALRMKDIKDRQDVNIERINSVAKDTEAIKGHVNSEKTAAEGRLALLENENKMLKGIITDKQMTANLLAQAVAQRGRSDPVLAAAAVINPAVLDSIDKNTAETAENTARTDATVTDIKDNQP